MLLGKKRMAIRLLMILMGFFISLVTTSAASAKGILEHQDTMIPKKQTVDNVVVAGGDATIYGTVKNMVIVFNGDLDIEDSARIRGMVVVFGGDIKQSAGAELNDMVLNISLDSATKNNLLFGGGLVAGLWVVQLLFSLLLVIIPVVTVLIVKRRVEPWSDQVRRLSGHLLYTGFFSSVLLLAVSMLLMITLIGIPLVLILLLLALASCIAGLTAVSSVLGERLQGNRGRPAWFVTLVGAGMLAAGVNVPFVGLLLLLGIVWISLGLATMRLWRKIRKEQH